MSDAPATAVVKLPLAPRDIGWGRAALALIVVLAAVVRLAQLNAQSLSMDEVKDLAMARGSVADLQISEDRFPPLYHTLLHEWLRVVSRDVTGRGFSTLCGVLTVVAVGGLGRVLGGRSAGLWAAGLAAIAPFDVWYSVEARAYSLYILLGALAIWQFAAAMKDNSAAHWAGFAVASIAGAYTHYYFGLLIALAGLAFLANWPRRDAVVRGLTTFAVIAAATAPSLWLLKNDLNHPWGYARTSAFSLPGLAYTYFSYLTGYTLGPSLRDLHTLAARDAAIAAAPWVALLGAAIVVLVALAAQSYAADERKRQLAWLATFCLAPAAIIGIVSRLVGFGYSPRHALWAAAPLMAMLAVGAARGRPRWLAGAATVVLAAGFAVAHFNRLVSLSHRNEDARAVATFVTAQDSQAPIFVLSGYMSGPLAAYLPAGAQLFALPSEDSNEHAEDLAVDTVRMHSPPGQSFWLAYTRPFHGDPQGKLFAALDDAFELHGIVEFAGFQVYSGKVR
jgi:hypothetical protein